MGSYSTCRFLIETQLSGIGPDIVNVLSIALIKKRNQFEDELDAKYHSHKFNILPGSPGTGQLGFYRESISVEDPESLGKLKCEIRSQNKPVLQTTKVAQRRPTGRKISRKLICPQIQFPKVRKILDKIRKWPA